MSLNDDKAEFLVEEKDQLRLIGKQILPEQNSLDRKIMEISDVFFNQLNTFGIVNIGSHV